MSNMDVCMENIFLDNKHVHYFKQMEEDKQKKDALEFLVKLTDDAIEKENNLHEAFKEEDTVFPFVHLSGQVGLGIRMGTLEFSREKLEEVKYKDMELHLVDKIMEELGGTSSFGEEGFVLESTK